MLRSLVSSIIRSVTTTVAIVVGTFLLCIIMVVCFVSGAQVASLGSARVTVSVPQPTPKAMAPRPLTVLNRSVIMIKSTWSGLLTIPAESGPITVPVEYGGQCSAWFTETGARPTLTTSAHCVYEENIRMQLMGDVYGKLFGAPVKLPPQSEWTLEGANTKPVSRQVQMIPTFDSVEAFGRISPRMTVASHGSPTTDDFATIGLSAPVKGAVALPVAWKVPSLGSPIMSIGYPGSYTCNVEDSYRQADHPQGNVTDYEVLSSGQSITGVSAAIAHGMSGGPTVDRYGNVVGLNMLSVGEGKYFITDTSALRDYLRAHGVKTAKPSTRPLAFNGN